MWKIKNRSCVLLLLLALCFLPALCGSSVQAEADVSDIRRGAQSVTEQLDRAESGQREETKSIDRAAEAASDSQRAAGEIQSIERRDADLISGSEEILQRVRERGKTENQS